MKYFKPHEFVMGEEEVYDRMDKKFLDMLDNARHYAKTPFKITSSYRSPEYNESVGGSPNSSHMRGLAVDIAVKDSRQRLAIVDGAIRAGFNRIGVAETFVHIDFDGSKTPYVMWTY